MKKIENYPMYAVTEDGKVYSYKYQRFLKPYKTWTKNRPNSPPRLSVQLWNSGGGKRFFVHRLVGAAYIPNPDNLPQINHLDCNPLNNHYKNLEWCTAEHNTQYAIRLGRHQAYKNRVLSDDTVRKIRQMYMHTTLTEISNQLGIKLSTVNDVLKRRTYRHVV